MIRTIGTCSLETLEQNLKRLKLKHIRDNLEAINEVALAEEPSYLQHGYGYATVVDSLDNPSG